jgi:hypothetical protein
MIAIKKLNADDLAQMSRGLEIDIKDFSDIGSIHYEVNGVYANINVPTLIDQKKEVTMLIKFHSMNEKVAFTFSDTEIREQSLILTEPQKYDLNYILDEKDKLYQVFVKNGVVTYLTEDEVTGLYLIFNEVKRLLETKCSFN